MTLNSPIYSANRMASNQTTTTTTNSGYTFYQQTLKSPQYILAPMVDQSELPFRMLCRRYGAQLCYTPMLHAGMFLKDKNYRAKNFTTHPLDRPLIVQFCANDPHTLLEAARLVQDRCDAVDINLGCPQSIAKKGNYGAFLQDKWELVGQLIATLCDHLSVPVTCKIRVFSDVRRTVEYARFLEAKGCNLLTVHGRTRDQKGVLTGKASWEHILAVKRSVHIPVFANGNILNSDDVIACLEATATDGVMSAEGMLYNPALFSGVCVGVYEMAREYLDMVDVYPVHTSAIRGHLFKLFHDLLQDPNFAEFRQEIGTASDVKKLTGTVERIGSEIQRRGEREKWICRTYLHHVIKEDISTKVNTNYPPVTTDKNYLPVTTDKNYLPVTTDKNYLPVTTDKNYLPVTTDKNYLPVTTDKNYLPVTTDKNYPPVTTDKNYPPVTTDKNYLPVTTDKTENYSSNFKKARTELYELCLECGFNPKCAKCSHDRCKKCCKGMCILLKLSCEGHRFNMR